MFLIRRRDLQRDGANPTILYGYGGFSVSLTPAFAPGITAWLDRGGLYAIPNLRGGGEYGEAWHEAPASARRRRSGSSTATASRRGRTWARSSTPTRRSARACPACGDLSPLSTT
jgi:prolyl oligopeptidase PreP (S9A serine peptidase family)